MKITSLVDKPQKAFDVIKTTYELFDRFSAETIRRFINYLINRWL